jgi:hypothetical protein
MPTKIGFASVPVAVIRTVPSLHLRNVFRKLNVFSRVEVARAVERAEGKEQALSQ